MVLSGLRHYEGKQTERPSQEDAAKVQEDDKTVDRREVGILTTAHAGDTMVTDKTNPVTKEPIVKLSAVNYYNKSMGAGDRSDQMVTCNAFKRRTLKWWKKSLFPPRHDLHLECIHHPQGHRSQEGEPSPL